MLFTELLFSDDCTLLAHTEDLQLIIYDFVTSSQRIWSDYQLEEELISKDVDHQLAKACSSLGHLQKHVWQTHSLRLLSKIQVYKAVVLSTLLYGSESWVLHRKHIRLLKCFHQQCLRSVMETRWQDFKTNTEVLEEGGLPSIYGRTWVTYG